MRNVFLFVGFVLVMILDGSAQVQWQSLVSTLKGGGTIPSDPHPLSYWTVNPILRDKGRSLCLGCARRGGGVITEQDYAFESEVSDLGMIAGYPIFQVDNHIVAKVAPADLPAFTYPATYRHRVHYKILLAQTGADEYREIYHLENEDNVFPPLTPARIIQTDTASVLVTMDSDGGNAGGCNYGYWWFDKAGPHPLNFDVVDAAIKSRIPTNSVSFARCTAINFDTQEINAWVQQADAACHACGNLGTTRVRFVLRGSIVEPTLVEFIPDAPQ